MYPNLWNEQTQETYDRIFDLKIGFGAYQKTTMVFLAISYGATLTTFLAYCINIPIIKTVWDLDLTDLSFIFSFIAIGGFIGILLGKYVSDTYGRKSAIFVGSLIHSLFGISASFASSIQGFSILSFGSILGASFGFQVPQFYVEIIPSSKKSSAHLYLQIFQSCLLLYFILIASVFHQDLSTPYNWRMMLLLTVVPSVIVLFGVAQAIEESPKFLLLQGKFWKCFNVFNIMARINNSANYIGLNSADNYDLYLWQKSINNRMITADWTDLVDRENFRRSWVLLINWIGLNFIYYGLPFIFPLVLIGWPEMGSDVGLYAFLFVILGDVLATIQISLLDNFTMQKRVYLSTSYLIAAVVFLIVALGSTNWLPWTLILVRIITRCCYDMLSQLTAESYRSQILEGSYNIITHAGYASTMIVPFFTCFLIDFGKAVPLLGFAVVGIILAISLIFYPPVIRAGQQVQPYELHEILTDRGNEGLSLESKLGLKSSKTMKY